MNKKLLIKRKSQKLVYRFLRVLKHAWFCLLRFVTLTKLHYRSEWHIDVMFVRTRCLINQNLNADCQRQPLRVGANKVRWGGIYRYVKIVRTKASLREGGVTEGDGGSLRNYRKYLAISQVIIIKSRTLIHRFAEPPLGGSLFWHFKLSDKSKFECWRIVSSPT